MHPLEFLFIKNFSSFIKKEKEKEIFFLTIKIGYLPNVSLGLSFQFEECHYDYFDCY